MHGIFKNVEFTINLCTALVQSRELSIDCTMLQIMAARLASILIFIIFSPFRSVTFSFLLSSRSEGTLTWERITALVAATSKTFEWDREISPI